jgi:hypothetical protein
MLSCLEVLSISTSICFVHLQSYYGIKGKLLFWLKSYLSRRKQRVVIKDAISSTGELKAGVPQGSVLGPLLFLIFINDVADNMTGFGRLFADDTYIGHMGHNEENLHTLISTDLEYLNAWSYRWLVKFNHNKTHIMIFSTRHLENNSVTYTIMSNSLIYIQRGNYIYNILFTNFNIRENIQASTIKIR